MCLSSPMYPASEGKTGWIRAMTDLCKQHDCTPKTLEVGSHLKIKNAILEMRQKVS